MEMGREGEGERERKIYFKKKLQLRSGEKKDSLHLQTLSTLSSNPIHLPLSFFLLQSGFNQVRMEHFF